MNKNYRGLFILTLLLMPVTCYLLTDTFDFGTGMCWILGLITLAMIILTFIYAVDKELATPEDNIAPAFKWFRAGLILIFILSLFPAKQPIKMWNESVVAYNTFTQRTQQKEGFFDKMYKTYSQKVDISYINFEQFKQITVIIMENKKDGAQLAWKWLSEQKVIPFEEFTSLWKDLSSFIQTQREGYYQLEVECQQLAYANNTLLSTFPNRFYNFFLRRPYAKYSYGFTSDETEKVFRTGKENIK